MVVLHRMPLREWVERLRQPVSPQRVTREPTVVLVQLEAALVLRQLARLVVVVGVVKVSAHPVAVVRVVTPSIPNLLQVVLARRARQMVVVVLPQRRRRRAVLGLVVVVALVVTAVQVAAMVQTAANLAAVAAEVVQARINPAASEVQVVMATP